MSDIKERLERAANAKGAVSSGFDRKGDVETLKALCAEAAEELGRRDKRLAEIEGKEPVAWLVSYRGLRATATDDAVSAGILEHVGCDVKPLYAHPPARSEAESCPECGSTDLEWHCGRSATPPDGKLRLHDVHVFFALGCNECSETVRTISGEEAAAILTEVVNE